MRCIDSERRPSPAWLAAAALAALLGAGCRSGPSGPSVVPAPPSPTAPPAPATPTAPAAPAPFTGAGDARAPAAPVPGPGDGPARPPFTPEAGRAPDLPPPTARARNWAEYRQRAGQRIAAANAGRVYLGEVPEPLLAIPVLEVELEPSGHVRRITVLRQPRQAHDTVQLAIDAVRRAEPFGPVAHLPHPWKFVETFLFDDDRRFKPRSLDEP